MASLNLILFVQQEKIRHPFHCTLTILEPPIPIQLFKYLHPRPLNFFSLKWFKSNSVTLVSTSKLYKAITKDLLFLNKGLGKIIV